jgi:hypothetical protein
MPCSETKKARPSFLKKRSKRLLFSAVASGTAPKNSLVRLREREEAHREAVRRVRVLARAIIIAFADQYHVATFNKASP